MPNPPALSVVTRKTGRPRHGLCLAPPSITAAPLALDGVGVVEIVAPDRQSAALLVEFIAPAFPVDLVVGSSWIVRVRPPPAAGNWVDDLLALVECWLKAAPLPCAKLLRDGRSYLIRGPLDAA